MIIDKNGKIYSGVYMGCGTVVQDGDFFIFLPYEREEDCKRAEEILQLKRDLSATDYKLMKYVEGFITDEEYAEVKRQRSEWRAKINQLESEILMPTITREEMDRAEETARKGMKK